MQIRRFAAAAAAVLAFSSPALAQDADPDDAPNGLRKGAWSLSFTSPGSSERAELGAWRMVSDRTNLGVTVGFARTSREREQEDPDATFEETGTELQLGLAARRYLSQLRSASPYLQGRLFGSLSTVDHEGDLEDRAEGRSLGGELALGAEWFPVRQLSVSGHTGLRVVGSWFEQEATDPLGQRVETTASTIASFTSALSLSIYF